jgi:enoyl-CoA hydratase
MLRSEISEQGVGTITLARPLSKNALSFALLEALYEACSILTSDSAVRVIILAHEGDTFCAGGDLNELALTCNPQDAERLASLGTRTLSAIANSPKPVIAALSGPAIGGGAELALACDFRVVGPRASLEFRHVKLATVPAWGSTQRLVRLVGLARATSILMRGTRLDSHAIEAQGLGEYAALDALAQAHALAAELAKLSREALACLKATFAEPERERELFLQSWVSRDHQDAFERLIRARSSALAK